MSLCCLGNPMYTGYTQTYCASETESFVQSENNQKCPSQNLNNGIFNEAIENCQYPTISYGPCYSYHPCSCINSGINLNFGVAGIVLLGGSLLGIFIASHLFIQDRTGATNWKLGMNLLAYTAIPALDVISNLVVITNSAWCNATLFAFAWIFFFAPSSIFIYQLRRDNIRMKTFIPFWTFQLPPSLLFDQYDTLSKVMITFFGSMPFVLINGAIFAFRHYLLIPHVLWFLFGYFLFSTKVMCIGRVQRFWHQIWTGENDTIHKHIIDQRQLNEQYVSILMLESFPWLIFQIVNMSYLSSTGALQILSIIFSGLMILAGIYRYGYYFLYHKSSIDKIPIPMSAFFDIGGDYNPEEDNVSKVEDLYKAEDVIYSLPERLKTREIMLPSISIQAMEERVSNLEEQTNERFSFIENKLSEFELLLRPISQN